MVKGFRVKIVYGKTAQGKKGLSFLVKGFSVKKCKFNGKNYLRVE